MPKSTSYGRLLNFSAGAGNFGRCRETSGTQELRQPVGPDVLTTKGHAEDSNDVGPLVVPVEHAHEPRKDELTQVGGKLKVGVSRDFGGHPAA